MNDPTHNPGDDSLWPKVTVVGAWAYSTGGVRMGFSLSPSWAPPPDFEREADRSNTELIGRMHFPAALAWWLMEEFRARRLTSVSIQRAPDRWRVHLNLSVRDYEVADLLTIANGLMAAARLPEGSDGQRVRELDAISGEHPDYNESDTLFHWLSDRVKKAVQAIFDNTRE